MRVAFFALLLGFLLARGWAQQEGPLRFDVDLTGQVDGNCIFRLVDNTWAVGAFHFDEAPPPDNWVIEREEGVIRHMADWYGLSNPENRYRVDSEGRYVFKPDPGTLVAIENWALRGGARPLIVCGTNTMPAPLIEGGETLGTYGYNVRQPKDYEAWRFYLESMLQWLIDQYGRDEVRHWGFMYGIEADWQAKAVYPGTDTEMNWEDNRREFIKQLDYFHAACEAKLGPNVYVGCYFAMETQAAMYFEHWAGGINYATGLRGTRIGFCGLSDWTHVGKFAWNPFDPEGRNKRDEWGYIAGLPYRYNYLENLLAQYPELRRLEVALPEAGYIDPQGGAFPAPVSYADSRGAALYGLRLMAYAACPRLAWAFNRYALSVGDMEYSWDDTLKPPLDRKSVV